MTNDNYVVIQGFMCNELGLKGNELLVYALLHGFSQDGESWFSGSRKYIARTFNISLPTVDKTLTALLDKQLIRKETATVNGVILNKFKTLQGVKKLYTPRKETLPNNIVNNIDNNTNSNELVEKPKRMNRFERCVSFTDEFVDTVDADHKDMIRDLLDRYLNMRLEMKDKPMYAGQWKSLLDKLAKLCEDDADDMVATIRQSLERGYASFYPVKTNKQTTTHTYRAQTWDDAKSETYTQAERDRLETVRKERGVLGIRTQF